ncbi:Ferredoxin [Pyrobaculum oguniense TE7]|uniref:Ferredoxin n=1 Tax=Pyrobaculum oguniense (strain DSM 13380 / JCM 10595 / TE7) TaxID=698757 RepID=H6Q642_PYROT|nr:Ferredoxin [Pyrobaculum oguniense TE7]
MPVKVRIDRSKCVVAHFCLFYAPTVFVPGEGGKPAVAAEYSVNGSLEEGVVPDELFESVKEAERHCPSRAIKVYRE